MRDMGTVLKTAAVLVVLSAGAKAQVSPTRLGLISTVLRERMKMFNQPVLLNGCSMEMMVDSVTRSMGSLDSAFTPFVRGRGEQCPKGNFEVGGGPIYVMSFYRIDPGPGDIISPDLFPAMFRTGWVRVLLKVFNIRTTETHEEEWVLGPHVDGRYMVLSMRVSSIGTGG